MIGKAEWFRRRKYFGWGLAPATWQGWAYVAAMIAAIFGVQALPFPGESAKTWVMLAVALVFSADVVHMMFKQKKDERDRLHEAIAERNALWSMMLVLVVGVAWQAAASSAEGDPRIDPAIVAALAAALVAKAATNLYLDRKD